MQQEKCKNKATVSKTKKGEIMLKLKGISIEDPRRMFILEDIYVEDENGQLYLLTQIEEYNTLVIEKVDSLPENLDWKGDKQVAGKIICNSEGKLQLVVDGCVSKHINTGVC